MKKYIKIIVFCIIAFTLGYLNNVMIEHGVWQHIHLNLGSVPFYVHILYWMLAFVLAIAVHELGHFISFKRSKIDVKAIYILLFAFVKIDGKWRLKLFPKFLIALGGLVMPHPPEITSAQQQKQMIDIYRRALIAGPNTSKYYFYSLLIIGTITFFLSPLYGLNGFLFSLVLSTALYTLLIMRASNLSYQGLYGDFVAYRQLNENKVFALAYLISGSQHIESQPATHHFLWPQIIEVLEQRSDANNPHIMSLYQYYLVSTIFDTAIGSTAVDKKIKGIQRRLSKTEDAFIFEHLKIYFDLIHHEQDGIQALNHLKENNRYEKVSAVVKAYWFNLSERILDVNLHEDYFKNLKYTPSSQMAWIYQPIESKVEIPKIRKKSHTS